MLRRHAPPAFRYSNARLGCLPCWECCEISLRAKGDANAALLAAIQSNRAAASDLELWELLHLGLPFVLETEARTSRSFDELIERYRSMQAEESAWLAAATEPDLTRILEDAAIPGGRCSVSEALMQVCLHSHGHRSQAAKLLRRNGQPPQMDLIVWLTTR